jgi:hypothetical protein
MAGHVPLETILCSSIDVQILTGQILESEAYSFCRAGAISFRLTFLFAEWCYGCALKYLTNHQPCVRCLKKLIRLVLDGLLNPPDNAPAALGASLSECGHGLQWTILRS